MDDVIIELKTMPNNFISTDNTIKDELNDTKNEDSIITDVFNAKHNDLNESFVDFDLYEYEYNGVCGDTFERSVVGRIDINGSTTNGNSSNIDGNNILNEDNMDGTVISNSITDENTVINESNIINKTTKNENKTATNKNTIITIQPKKSTDTPQIKSISDQTSLVNTQTISKRTNPFDRERVLDEVNENNSLCYDKSKSVWYNCVVMCTGCVVELNLV
ncbi:hypothetical protein NAPIS_ORF00084 [Vairimorpha apis BRL 01]|uniref:Uncharacterized protein n=1 Tax=Vairimorpha apis BRL 01 TaxID=1037528 RepID=T0LDI8_9MICR|nr:hypothetical protein NAPIS_ORF00084 [Vairimorpha apis BRL 01]